jgi:hypothetical protein
MNRTASLSWFEKELTQLQESAHVRLFIHVTREDVKPENPNDIILTKPDVSSNNTTPIDIEKSPTGIESNVINPQLLLGNTHKGRPDISTYISMFVDCCSPSDRVGIGACGPVDMVDSVTRAVSRGVYDDGPSITVYTEVSVYKKNNWACKI